MTGVATGFENVKVGDRVRFTVEGEVSYFDEYWINIGRTSYSLSDITAKVEVLQKPLKVGDVVTEEDVPRLRALGKKYVLVDAVGDPWDSFPSCGIQSWLPFTLVYIHPESE